MRKILIASIISMATLSTTGFVFGAGAGAGGARSTGQQSVPTNSNGLRSADRDFGKDRAADRRTTHANGEKRSPNVHAKRAVKTVHKKPNAQHTSTASHRPLDRK
jgi:hypothetical protein